jgi:hypothetical protein
VSFLVITPKNAKAILQVNNRAMMAICRDMDRSEYVSAQLVSIVSKRIAEAEAVLAEEARIKARQAA